MKKQSILLMVVLAAALTAGCTAKQEAVVTENEVKITAAEKKRN